MALSWLQPKTLILPSVIGIALHHTTGTRLNICLGKESSSYLLTKSYLAPSTNSPNIYAPSFFGGVLVTSSAAKL